MFDKALDRWLSVHPLPALDASKEDRATYFASMPKVVVRAWEIRKSAVECEHPDYNSGLAARAKKRMMRVDEFPIDVREAVYENGLEIVQEFWNMGIRKGKQIQHLIDTVRMADFPDGQPRFKINKGPNSKRNPINDEEYYSARK